jgi:hypothetical protein
LALRRKRGRDGRHGKSHGQGCKQRSPSIGTETTKMRSLHVRVLRRREEAIS